MQYCFGKIWIKSKSIQDFPGGPVVKTPPANAEDMGSIPASGRFHMLWDNQAHVPQLQSPHSTAHDPQLLKLMSPWAGALQEEKQPQWKACALRLENSLQSPKLERAAHSKEDPVQPKIKNIYTQIHKLNSIRSFGEQEIHFAF